MAAVVVVFSVTMSKISERFGVPALLLFIGLGMLAGSDGPGGIYFDNALLSQTLGLWHWRTFSSTGAAAVFAVLRSRGVGLKESLQPLLELESGSNDPMAVSMTASPGSCRSSCS